MQSTSFVLPKCQSSLVDGEIGKDNDTTSGSKPSKPSNVWCTKHKFKATSMGDQTTVNLVVTVKVFLKINLCRSRHSTDVEL
jgi:hypothetical protein